MSVDLTKKDVTSPKKFLKKFGMGLLSGVGGIAQELGDAAITPYLGNANPILVKFGEWILTALAGGAVDQPYFDAAIAGANGAASKDLVKSLFAKFMPDVLPKLSGSNGKGKGPSEAPIAQNTSAGSGYII